MRFFGLLTTVALYWADGQRSVTEISALAEHEVGWSDVDLLARFFEVLVKQGFAAWA
jgi:hypothetical protein